MVALRRRIKRPRGNPKLQKKVKMPEPLPEFRGRGHLTEYGRGLVRQHLWSGSTTQVGRLLTMDPSRVLRLRRQDHIVPLSRARKQLTLTKKRAVVRKAPPQSEQRKKLLREAGRLEAIGEDIDVPLLAYQFDAAEASVRRWLRAGGWELKSARWVPNNRGPLWRQKRVRFCRWFFREFGQNPDPAKFIFSDEKIFRAQAMRKKDWVRRDKDGNWKRKQVPRERFVCGTHVFGLLGMGYQRVLEIPKVGSGKKGGFAGDDFVKLLSKNSYITRLKTRLAGKWLLLDGASVHRCAVVRGFLERHGIRVLPDWPPHSPDLNPIENWWAWLQRRCSASISSHWQVNDGNRERIWSEVRATAAATPSEIMAKLAASFATRLRTCLENDGEYVGK